MCRQTDVGWAEKRTEIDVQRNNSKENLTVPMGIGTESPAL